MPNGSLKSGRVSVRRAILSLRSRINGSSSQVASHIAEVDVRSSVLRRGRDVELRSVSVEAPSVEVLSVEAQSVEAPSVEALSVEVLSVEAPSDGL
eukprot:CAMPEP_0119507870 /NCGR_PEP_ID=MMETSP1344-20130328/27646_1 /TAXON_ID=236787 /ORGANISM="Florenciella parvula, Strain CCMP2471" /LENGTH=95 /DNA_ID=CAMNT_0007544541 /DNA_START=165 /DNA_END=449 /DNA_ORIENTATION=-